MTLADMSVITAEVKVDETDIVNVAHGPARRRHGRCPARPHLQRPRHRSRRPGPAAHHRRRHHAIHHRHRRGQGLQSRRHARRHSTQTSDDLRPGLSTTAKITTAHKPNALTIPIQALVQRDPAAEEELCRQRRQAASSQTPPQPCRGHAQAAARPGRLRAQQRPRQTARRTLFRSRPASPARPTSKCSRASKTATRSSPAATRSCAPSRAEPQSNATTRRRRHGHVHEADKT